MRFIEPVIFIYHISVNHGMSDAGRHGKALKWRPAALIKYIAGSNGLRFIEIGDHQVSKISFPYVSSFLNAETICYCMAHLLYNFFKGDLTNAVVVQHQLYGMLHQW